MRLPPGTAMVAGTLPTVRTSTLSTATAWLLMLMSRESILAVLATDTALAHTVPFVCALTTPVVGLMVAIPVPGTMLQVTSWLAVAGNTTAVILRLPPGTAMVAG
ncbi:hypothetical protein, partial [uncultured Dysgonomonas sp.]|uniref:hypothetical protein n=1 Tax=uncultured Dysgonomonas sp. TaxID=206096 RepID=UPI00261335A4